MVVLGGGDCGEDDGVASAVDGEGEVERDGGGAWGWLAEGESAGFELAEEALCVRVLWGGGVGEGVGVVGEVGEGAGCFGAGGFVADDDEVGAGAGDGDVDELSGGPDPVEGAGFGAGADGGGEDDDVAFVALEAVGGADGDGKVLEVGGLGDFIGDEVGVSAEKSDHAEAGWFGLMLEVGVEGGEEVDAGLGLFIVGAGRGGGVAGGVVPGEVCGGVGERGGGLVVGHDSEVAMIVVEVGVGDDVGVAAVVFVEEDRVAVIGGEDVGDEVVEAVGGVGVAVEVMGGVVVVCGEVVVGGGEEADVAELVGVADDDGVFGAVEEG